MQLSFSNHMDMTKGKPWKRILWFSFPLILGNVLQELYSVTDSAIVSRFIGLNALAAIGGTSWVRSAFLRICMDCSAAFSIAASQRVGAGNQEGFRKVMAEGVKFGLLLSVALISIMVPLLDIVLDILQIQPNIYNDARLYLLLMILAIPLSVAYNMTCAFLRASGDSRTSFQAILISSLTNILLDLLFVAVLGWGVGGAALATMAAQMCSVIIVLQAAVKDSRYHIPRAYWKRDVSILKEMAKLWIPMFGNSVAISVGGVIAQRPINASGSIVAAGIGVGVRIYCLLEASEKAVASGIGVFVGQNMGAGQYGNIRRGMKSMAVFSMIFSFAVMAVLHLADDFLILLFINKNQPYSDLQLAISSAKVYLGVQAVAIFLMVPMHFFRSALQAMGHVIYPLIGAFLQVGARTLTVIFLPEYFGLAGLCMPDGTSALVTLPVVVIPYLIYIRNLQRKETEKNQEGKVLAKK